MQRQGIQPWKHPELSLLQLPLCENCPEDINALTRQFNQSPGTLLPYADLTNTEHLPRFTMIIKQARRTSTYKILTSEAHICPFSFMIENIVFMMNTAEYKQNIAKFSIHNSKSKKRNNKILCNCFNKFKQIVCFQHTIP